MVAASLTGAPADGAPKPVNPQEPSYAHQADNLPNPLAESKTDLTEQAIAAVISGKAKAIERNGSQVVRVGGNRWAELKKKADKVDPIFVVLSQFSDTTHPVIGGTPGPQKNEIPEPDRTQDNSTNWKSDFNQAHFDQVYNGSTESVADFYYQQSGAKYTTKASVSDWVQVPYNEARYGSNNFSQTSTYWPFIRDTANAWYNAQIAAGKTPAEVADYLKQFDVYDRYDADGDGNFNEPDGYIDHFQAVHAGEGEEAGGGAQGADAIWSHRWYAYSNGAGSTGPTGALLGGTQIGTTGIWIGDYTIQPENGGLGVFAHEFGHDLGLPDLYDTAGGDNSTAFWTLMSGGSWMSHSTTEIGTSPVYMGPYEKLFLGWLDYTTVENGKTKMVSLGSAATPKGLPQAVLVPLPQQTLTTNWNTPFSGSYEWWGGSADDLNNTLERTIDLTGATSASLSTKVMYDIEEGFDYLYGEVSTNGGASWTNVGGRTDGSVDVTEGLDGSSAGAWVGRSYDLSAYLGQTVKFRFRYQTDGGVHYSGPFLDNITLTTDGVGAFSDDVEAGVGAWTAGGFTRFTGTSTRTADHFYLAEYRSYTGYDKNLKTGPYNFVGGSKPDWVEKFPYQDGLLVWYVNYAYGDNNTSADDQAGHGLALPIDARPAPLTFSDGSLLGNRRQPFDATFGLQSTDAVTLHRGDMTLNIPSRPGIPTFDDSDPNRYWSAANPWNSAKVAGDGVKITMWLEIPGSLPVVLLQVKN
ncbi:immune inhibitor A domain-containing protein [Catellatospora sp. TT07R-123]|uniref:immune inhibitor A domain-containing protein n=1 Tax=Catellatospora sp. TT07R-123 TaxID=2733863 RepID=UPI001FD3DD15|nr:immune inhibitor A domain-containing protein [Catellatospora sp. TT07R-123]